MNGVLYRDSRVLFSVNGDIKYLIQGGGEGINVMLRATLLVFRVPGRKFTTCSFSYLSKNEFGIGLHFSGQLHSRQMGLDQEVGLHMRVCEFSIGHFVRNTVGQLEN